MPITKPLFLKSLGSVRNWNRTLKPLVVIGSRLMLGSVHAEFCVQQIDKKTDNVENKMNTVVSFDIGVVNLGIWIGRLNYDTGRYITDHWELVDILSRSTVADACNRLVDALNARNELLCGMEPNPRRYIIIESQPDSNVKMKCLSHVLQSWFYSKRIVPERNIKFVSARNKLLVYTKPLDDDVPFISNSYRYRKDMSVAHTRALLKEADEIKLLEFLNSHLKKDDLADAFLQGCYALKQFRAVDERVARREARVASRKTPKTESRMPANNAPIKSTVAENNVESGQS